MQDSRRSIPRQHVVQFRVLRASARGEEAHILLRVTVSAVAAPAMFIRRGTAVVRFHQQQGILQPAAFLNCLRHPADPAVRQRDRSQVLRRAVAVGVARPIRYIEMEVDQGKIVPVDIVHGGLDQLVALSVDLIYAEIVLNDAVVDVSPFAEGSHFRIRPVFPDYPEHGRIGRIGRECPLARGPVGQPVAAAVHPVQDTSPAFRADGRQFGQRAPADGPVAEDTVNVGGGSLLKKSAGSVHTKQDNPFRPLLHVTMPPAANADNPIGRSF